MQVNLRDEYTRIGQERDAAGREFDRSKLWFFVRIGAVCWAWTIAGAVVMAQAFHIDASVGQFYFPERMETAQLWMKGGLLIGTGGPLGTLIWGWRTAGRRGYFD